MTTTTPTRPTDPAPMSGLIGVTASDGVGQPHTGVAQRSHAHHITADQAPRIPSGAEGTQSSPGWWPP